MIFYDSVDTISSSTVATGSTDVSGCLSWYVWIYAVEAAAPRCVPPMAWRAACEAALGARGKEEQLTLVKLGEKIQKACKWKGVAAGEDALYVAMALVGTGYLQEEFRHSPYATNAYVAAWPYA